MQVIEAARGLAGELDKIHRKIERRDERWLASKRWFCQLGCGLPTARFHEAWSAASCSKSNLPSMYGIILA